MIGNKKILAIIPARGGSKGIKDKNLQLINGKPLIYYAINAAKKCKCIDKIVVSTDSKDISLVAKHYGACVPFMRPKNLASDNSKTIDCVIYTINKLDEMGYCFDILIILQPTSPLRSKTDILNSLKLFCSKNKNVASINKVDINPLLLRTTSKNNLLRKLVNKSSTLRRQDLPQFYKVNGAIYINDIKTLTKDTSFNDNEIGYIMSNRNSIDIDTKEDLQLARLESVRSRRS